MNNRNSGRRRSRGGRPSNRGPNDGNRLDNRARGNANQLCEKYKSMARDAHQQGDRVMNEYYLQFADHYFRVQAETNLRKEEQKRERDDNKPTQRSGDTQNRETPDQAAASGAPQTDSEPKKRAPRKKREPQIQEAQASESGSEAPDGEEQKIEADRLPAAFSATTPAEGDAAVNGSSGKKPVRRTRTTKTSKDEDDKGAAAEA
jgi:uncharacterized protein DUF4167